MASPKAKPQVVIFTDGACSGNPGPGGYGAILKWGEEIREISGFEPETTNNRMELMAAIAALEALKRPVGVQIVTDSMYLRQGVTQWMQKWRANGWRTSDKKSVKNRDLWEKLGELAGRFDIDWRWTKGHAGTRENERADELARSAIANKNVAE